MHTPTHTKNGEEHNQGWTVVQILSNNLSSLIWVSNGKNNTETQWITGRYRGKQDNFKWNKPVVWLGRSPLKDHLMAALDSSRSTVHSPCTGKNAGQILVNTKYKWPFYIWLKNTKETQDTSHIRHLLVSWLQYLIYKRDVRYLTPLCWLQLLI